MTPEAFIPPPGEPGPPVRLGGRDCFIRRSIDGNKVGGI
jgi:hypothetical protein